MWATPDGSPARGRLGVGLIAGALFAISTAGAALAGQQLEITIPTSLGDTTETFWLQIPDGYDPGEPRPLLIGWHQWSADHDEMRLATAFDSIADARGWLAASHDGPTPTHWNNQAAQSHVVDVIRWIDERYAVDSDRVYMVGSSMGGAAGMVFSNNHLDPDGPMIAAAASISGIQDCERRFQEQGVNYSMIAAFGGTPEEAPFEYRRNSAICFADSTASMHVNARHLPLWLTFGHGETDQPWRAHAEDLFDVLDGTSDTVILRESALSGHGWGCAEAILICDFLAGFILERFPRRISVQADEAGAWYWARLGLRTPIGVFGRIEGEIDPEARRIDFTMLRNIASASLEPRSIGLDPDAGPFVCRWAILEALPAELSIQEVTAPPALVLRNGLPFVDWQHDPIRRVLTLQGEGSAEYAIFPESASAFEIDPGGPGGGAEDRELHLAAWPNPFRSAVQLSLSPRLSVPRAGRSRVVEPEPGDLLIFDLVGRRVARGVVSASAGLPPGGRWDGRDCHGHSLPAGRYLVRDAAGRLALTLTRVP